MKSICMVTMIFLMSVVLGWSIPVDVQQAQTRPLRMQKPARPDLGMYGFLKIGKFQKQVKWNETIELTPADALLIAEDGTPAFDLYYSCREFQHVPARGFKNKIYFNDRLVSTQSDLSLEAYEIESIHTHAYLGSTDGRLQIKIDADNEILESREDNNFHFYVHIRFRGFSPVALVRFGVTKVSAAVSPSSSSTCPTTFNFTGYITTSAKGTVKYKWMRSDNAVTPIQTLLFSGPGTKKVNSTWTIGAAGNHWKAIQIVSPNPRESNKASFHLECQPAQQDDQSSSSRFLQVVYPVNSQHFKVEGGRLILRVLFNRPVNPGTVTVGTTMVVKTPKDPNADGNITWINNQELRWVSQKLMKELCIHNPDCSFQLIIKDGVRDTSGRRLDGDKNGAPGGDFVHVFSSIG